MPLWAHLELVLCSALPCIHKRRKIVFKGRIRGQNCKYIRIRFVQKLYRVRKGTILAVLVNPQVPDNRGEQNNRGFHEEITLFLYLGLVQIQENGIG